MQMDVIFPFYFVFFHPFFFFQIRWCSTGFRLIFSILRYHWQSERESNYNGKKFYFFAENIQLKVGLTFSCSWELVDEDVLTFTDYIVLTLETIQKLIFLQFFLVSMPFKLMVEWQNGQTWKVSEKPFFLRFTLSIA